MSHNNFMYARVAKKGKRRKYNPDERIGKSEIA